MSRDAAVGGPGQPPSTATVGADETAGSSAGSDPVAGVGSSARCRAARLGVESREAVRDAGRVGGTASGLAVGATRGEDARPEPSGASPGGQTVDRRPREDP